jgi:hypothetical protein
VRRDSRIRNNIKRKLLEHRPRTTGPAPPEAPEGPDRIERAGNCATSVTSSVSLASSILSQNK